MADVVISYARSTAVAAQATATALRALGYNVWLDDELPAHRRFEEVIKEHLRAAKAVVVIWSAEAVKSDWVRSEANQAREAHKLVQLAVDETSPPMPFDQIHCAAMTGWSGDLNSPGWRQVVAGISELMSGPEVATRTTAPPPSVRRNSICVLPFVNMSGDPDQEYFSDGISEDIITDLSKVSALFVIGRNTAFRLKARSVDVTQLARQLDVSYVLEGSVRKAGDRVRITTQLLDGTTGAPLWAERYDRDFADIFAIQDEIADAVVTALKLKLLHEEGRTIWGRRPKNPAAYDLFLRGTRPVFTREENLASIELLESVTRLDPDYSAAWGELAHRRLALYHYIPYSERDSSAAIIAADAARASHEGAVLAQYDLLPRFGRFVEAESLLNEHHVPNDSGWHWHRSVHLATVGRTREAIEAARRRCEDPYGYYELSLLGEVLRLDGRYTEARQILQSALDRDPDNHFAASSLIQVCVHTRDWAAVDALMAPERLAQFPLHEEERWVRRCASAMRDPSPQDRIIEMMRERFAATGHAELELLLLAAQTGGLDEAYSTGLQANLGPAGSKDDAMGYFAYRPLLLFDAALPQFRRDPRFVQLCVRLGLVDYWLTTQHWPDCVDEVAPFYDFKVECQKVAVGPPLPPASESASLAGV